MKVLVCTDFSAASAAGELAAAKRFPDATLVVLHVVDRRFLQAVADRTGADQDRLRDDALAFADRRLDEIVERLTSQGREAIAELREGDPVGQALETAAEHAADVIVAGVPAGSPVGAFRTQLALRTGVSVLLVPGGE